jgi:hypothetical protein
LEIVPWVYGLVVVFLAWAQLTLESEVERITGTCIVATDQPWPIDGCHADFTSQVAPETNHDTKDTDDQTLVQIAIVYRGSRITLYRNSALYADYVMPGAPAGFGPEDSYVVFRVNMSPTP